MLKTFTITKADRKAVLLKKRWRNETYRRENIMPAVCLLIGFVLLTYAFTLMQRKSGGIDFAVLSGLFFTLGIVWHYKVHRRLLSNALFDQIGLEKIVISDSTLTQTIPMDDGSKFYATIKISEIQNFGYNERTGWLWYAGPIHTELTLANGASEKHKVAEIHSLEPDAIGAAVVAGLRASRLKSETH